MEIRDYNDVAVCAFNDMTETLEKQVAANTERTLFNQPQMSYSVDLKAILKDVTKRTKELHSNARDPNGTAPEWTARAQGRFRDLLFRYNEQAEPPELKSCLQMQFFEMWSELQPPRDLTSEEMLGLCTLQEQAEAIVNSLKQAIEEAIDGLWAIAEAEQGIITDTSARHMFLIHDRVQCHIAALAGIVRTLWSGKESRLAEPPEQIERHFMRAAPCTWADKQKEG